MRGAAIVTGLDPGRLSVEGYAAFRPVLPNSKTEGREANRRVEIRFYRARDEATARRDGPSEKTTHSNPTDIIP